MTKVPGSIYDSGNKTFRTQILKKQQQLEALMRALPNETKNILDEVGKESKEEMQRIIRESQSPFGAIRKSYGMGRSSGREDTGAMYDSVAYATEMAADRISVRVGWLYNFKEYFGFQENGFKQRWKLAGFMNGKFVFSWRANPVNQEGIHALRDARMFARQKLNDINGNLFNRLMNAYIRGGK